MVQHFKWLEIQFNNMNNRLNVYQFIFKFYNNIHLNIFKLYKMQKDVTMFIITYKILLEMFKVQLKINNKNC